MCIFAPNYMKRLLNYYYLTVTNAEMGRYYIYKKGVKYGALNT